MEIILKAEGHDEVHVKINDMRLTLANLKRYFPDAVGLTYQKNGKRFVQIMENDSFMLDEGVVVYDVYCQKKAAKSNLSDKQIKTFKEVIKSIKKKEPEMENELKKESTRMKIGKRKEKTRMISFTWKHRDSINEPFYKKSKPKETKELILNPESFYTVEEIIVLAVNLLKDDLNTLYFEKTQIELGLPDGRVITEFKSDKGEGLWNYVNKLSDKSHRLHMCILTTYEKSKSDFNFKKPSPPATRVAATSKTSIESVTVCTDTHKKILTPKSLNSESDFSTRKALEQSIQDNYVIDDLPKKSFKDSKEIENSISRSEDLPQSKKLKFNDIEKLQTPLAIKIPKEKLQITNKVLGRGAFGTVWKGFWNGTSVAIKSIDMYGGNAKAIIKEISILRELSHENIVKIMGVCQGFVKFHIVMELVDGKSLQDIIFEEDVKSQYHLSALDKQNITKQLLTAVSFMHLHERKFIHRDIKPANILVNTLKVVKICDFGLAVVNEMCSQLMTTQGKGSAKGTPFYMAPELFLHHQSATTQSDMWSLGCTLIEFYSERPVWNLDQCTDFTELLESKVQPNCNCIPQFFRGLMIQVFNYTPEKRPACSEILEKFLSGKEQYWTYVGSDED